MRIAVCLTGNLRNFKHTFPNFKKFVLDTLNPDIFFYGCENISGVVDNMRDFKKLYNPKKVVINSKEYYESISNKYSGLLRSFSPQFHNIEQCFKILNEYEKDSGFIYDVIIRVRTDCFFFREIAGEELTAALEGKCIMPIDWAFKSVHPKSETDQFFLSNRENYIIYSSLFQNLEKYHGVFNHPETIVGNYLFDNNIEVEHCNRHYVFEYFNEDNIEPIGFRALGEWTIPNGWDQHTYRKFFD
jgi:hypothetical protein